MFEIEFTENAFEDLAYLQKSYRGLILDEIEAHLSAEPMSRTKKRKPLRPNELSKWELRLGKYRVFYDIDEPARIVIIKAVGWKEHEKLLIQGREFEL